MGKVHIHPDTSENRKLAANLHPHDWINPEPAQKYNLVVIGAGTAGLVCAAGAAGLGAKVALIERHLMGGDCLNYGCVPSKGIIRAARAVYDARTSGRFGVRGGEGVSLDFSAAMARMRTLRSSISLHDSAARFRDELGVDVFIGKGGFISPHCIEVEGVKLLFDKAAVCTGARAGAPAIAGLAEAGYHTNETVFSLTELPPRLAVIGSGPIGCELAQVFSRFGSSVTIIERGQQILGREDSDAAGVLQAAFVREGIHVRFGANIKAVELNGLEKVLRLESGGEVFEVRADEILLGVGRIPNLDGLGLEAGGIGFDSSGVIVNDNLQSSNPDVYAAGDICSPLKFTHAADAQARMLIANALFMGRQKMSGLVMPWCTYTDPEIAHVGMYGRDAAAKGLSTVTLTVALTDVDRALLDGEAEGFARVLLAKGSDRILGATIVARHAGEMISELTLAITNGLGLAAIARTIHPYPTQAEVVRKLADAYNRTRLTPLLKKVLAGWLKWRRGQA